MASYLAPRVHPGAFTAPPVVSPVVSGIPVSSVPLAGHPHRSPYDPSTSGIPPPTAPTSPPNSAIQHPPKENSDCGSSSGVGGMKNVEVLSSDEAGSSSSPSGVSDGGPTATHPTHPLHASPMNMPPQAIPGIQGVAGPSVPPPLPAPYFVAPPPRPGFPGAPPLLPHGPPPPLMMVPPNGPPIQGLFCSPSDLFVHIQPGERLTLRVGNEDQDIIGPATVRMVGEAGCHPSALPIYVPPGHQIHQIVDENGVLRHLILSSEPSMAQRSQQPASMMNGYGRAGPSQIHNLVTVDRPNKAFPKTAPPRPPTAEPTPTEDQEDTCDMDVEEKDRLREMLNCIQAPSLVRVTDVEADLQWQELDTSEAAAPGGPFPQIDASEFSYSVILYENQANNPRYITTYQCDPEQGGNCLRLFKLRPLTDYFVQLKASLEERGIIGEPSKAVHFRTKPPRPNAPMPLRILETGTNFMVIGWNTAVEKTHSVHFYNVYVQLGNEPTTRTKMFSGNEERAVITNLLAGTRYDVFVSVMTDCGESSLSSPLRVDTRPDVKPQVPNIQNITARSVKMNWATIPDHKLSVEMSEGRMDNNIRVVREQIAGPGTIVDGLNPGTEYRFRLVVSGLPSAKSDWVPVRTTQAQRNQEHPSKELRVLVPNPPFVIASSSRRLEIGWKVNGARDREFTYLVEGSPRIPEGAQPKWKTIYRGEKTQVTVDEGFAVFRVQTFNKKGVNSDWSSNLVLPNPIDDLSPPAAPSVPELTVVDKSTVLVRWQTGMAKDNELPDGISWVIELRRKDDNNNVVYSGQEPSFSISGLAPQQRVEIQIRKVFMDESKRLEGAWSPVASISTPKEAPKVPRNVRVNQEKRTLEWTSDEDETTIYHVSRFRVIGEEKDKELEMNTKKQECSLGELEPASVYEFTVSASHEGGSSDPSAPLVYETRAQVPRPPEGVSAETMSMSEIHLRWERPDCCGAEVKQYIIKVTLDEEVVREFYVPSTAEQCDYSITGLEASTVYSIGLLAENEIGCSEQVVVTGRTRTPPPRPPTLDADSEPTQMRLRWRHIYHPSTDSSPIRYRVVRVVENEDDDTEQNVVAYDGEACQCKIRNLNENTIYKFKIRAIDKQVGPGAWSEVYEFSTTLAPPPGIKGLLSASNSGNGYQQIEWPSCINKQNPRRLFYSLEVQECGAERPEWTPVYEGANPQYTLKVNDYQRSLQVRVRCARVDPEGKKLYSTPSQTLFISNSSRGEPKSEPCVEVPAPTFFQTACKWVAERSFATLIIPKNDEK
ncbi:unnamed protein product, partial [Mesorhabditis belari]|uniref:Fibronectin type-III domain-containing protein n=1 Tax=Mesorhabditis belari TaxID=2138241 RepID=A0AAF3FIZ5_9BILA